jgi:hypothetical protein
MRYFTSLILLLVICETKAQPFVYTIDSISLQIIAFEGGKSEFKFADMNHDGFIDIISTGDHGSPFINTQQHGIMVYFGDGTATNWNLFQDGNFGYGGVAAGDLNNDGWMDIAYGIHHNYSTTDYGDQFLEAALGDGSGQLFIPWDDSLGLHGQTWGMFGTDLADMDNDGWLDIGSNSFGCCDGVHVYRNKGNGEWSRTFGFVGGNANESFIFGDINNDGFMDFVAARQGGTAYFGDGNGNFTLKDNGLPPSGILGFSYVDLADVDNDGTLELGFVMNGLFIYKWNELLQTWTDISGNLPAAGNFQSITFTDLNHDGFTDLVAFTSGMMNVFTGNASNVWTQVSNVPIPNLTTIRYVNAKDLNFDGRPEILVFGRFPMGLFNSVNKLYLLKENVPSSTLQIYPQKPLNGQCYPGGAVRMLEWSSSVPSGITCLVKLELSTSGASGPWTLIADSLPNNGSYQWLVPSGINSSNCVIRMTLKDKFTGVSYTSAPSAVFTIGCGLPSGLNASDKEYFAAEVFPNPSSDILQINFTLKGVKNLRVELTDLEGRILIKNALPADSGSVLWPVHHLESGIYLLNVFSENRKLISKKVLIQ